MQDIYEDIKNASEAYADFRDPIMLENYKFSEELDFSSKIVCLENQEKLETFYSRSNIFPKTTRLSFNDVSKGIGSISFKQSKQVKFCVHKPPITSKISSTRNSKCKSAAQYKSEFCKSFLPLLNVCNKCFPDISFPNTQIVTKVIKLLDQNIAPEPEDFIVAKQSELSDLIEKTYVSELKEIRKNLTIHSTVAAFSKGKTHKLVRSNISLKDMPDKNREEAKTIAIKTGLRPADKELYINNEYMLIWHKLSTLQKNLIAFRLEKLCVKNSLLKVTDYELQELDIKLPKVIASGRTIMYI